MNNIYTGFFNNGIVTILLLLIIFASVALLSSWIRRMLLPETKDTLKVDPKQAVKEELDRVLVTLETPLTPKINPTTSDITKVETSSPTTTKPSITKNAKKRRSKIS
jgi:hypothetical protein